MHLDGCIVVDSGAGLAGFAAAAAAAVAAAAPVAAPIVAPVAVLDAAPVAALVVGIFVACVVALLLLQCARHIVELLPTKIQHMPDESPPLLRAVTVPLIYVLWI